MGALEEHDLDAALAAGSEVALWHEEFRGLAAARARAQGRPARVHVKLDSGMGRLGNRDPEAVLALLRACAEDPTSSRPASGRISRPPTNRTRTFFDEQLERFAVVAAAVRAEFPDLTVHAANSAAVFREPRSHFDMARCGVAVYGLDPFQGDPAERGLAPALSLRSYVADVKRFDPGDSAGYGQTWRAESETLVGGTAAGLRRRGAARPLQQRGGTDRGPSPPARRHRLDGQRDRRPRCRDDVERGAEAVLIGSQGGESILAEELAAGARHDQL